MKAATAAVCVAALLSGCATTGTTTGSTGTTSSTDSTASAALPAGLDQDIRADPYPSTYRPIGSGPVAIVGATVFDGAGKRIENGTVLMRDGKIERVEAGLAAPAGYAVIDGRGKFVTPGIIDAHSHLGVYPFRECAYLECRSRILPRPPR